jgi:hypothetical protein
MMSEDTVISSQCMRLQAAKHNGYDSADPETPHSPGRTSHRIDQILILILRRHQLSETEELRAVTNHLCKTFC